MMTILGNRFSLLFLEVAAHRQDFLENGLVIAAQAKRLIAAEHDQSAAEFLDVGADHLHLPLRHRRGRHVRDHEQFVVLQVGELVGDALRRARVDDDPFLLQRPAEVLGQFGVALDQQHARLAGAEDEALRGVVVLEFVLEAFYADGVFGQSLVDDRLLEAEMVLAFLDLDLLADDLVGAAEDFDLPLVIVIGIDDDVHVERLAFTDLRGHLHVRDLHFKIGARRQRNGGDRHAAAQSGFQTIAASLVAVAEQDDVGHIGRRNRRGRYLDGRGDVGAFGFERADLVAIVVNLTRLGCEA